MSIKVMNRVWTHAEHGQTKLLVLLALADFADDDGLCWPSQAILAKKARCSPRQVQRMLSELEASGDVKVTSRKDEGKSNLYRVMVGQNVAPPGDDAEVVGGTTPNDVPGTTPVSHDPSLNHQDPSSSEQAKPARSRRLSQIEQARAYLEDVFSEAANLTKPQELHPNGLTKAQAKAASTRWWKPLDEMYLQAGKDADLVEECIKEAVWHHRRSNLNCSAPASILETTLSMIGDRKEEGDGYRVGRAS